MHTRWLWLVTIVLIAAATLGAAPTTIHYRHASGKWLSLPCESARGVISFTLDPAQIGGGSTTVVLGDAKGIALDDETAPRVVGLKVDGTPMWVGDAVDLDWLAEHPRQIIIGVSDRANRLDPSSLRLQLNGQPLQTGQFTSQPSPDGKSLRLVLPVRDVLGDQPPFVNIVDVRVSDLAPAQNTTSLRLTYRALGAVTGDPTALVDTIYPGYEDLAVLTDGKVMEPGTTTYKSTWASEEESGDHWLVLAWPQEKTLYSVEVFWAIFQGTYHAPRELLVQTWDGRQWVTQKALGNLKAERSTLIELPGVRASRLRLFQPDGQGHPVRPSIMWITEVSVK